MANSSRSRVFLHPLLLDVGLTAATEFSVLVAGLLIVSLLGRKLGAVALGEYLLLRRVYGWLQAGALLGLGGALTWHVAHAEGKPAAERRAYFCAAVLCGSGVTFCWFALLNGAAGFLARWMFGSEEMKHLIFPLSLLLTGGMASVLVTGYYRGQLIMKRANTLQLCVAVLVPLGAVLALFRKGSVALIMDVVGVSTLLCATLFAIPIVRQLMAGPLPNLGRHAAELLRYGVPRLPAAFSHGAIFALAPMIATHYLPVGKVSYLLLGVSLVMLVSASADPLGLVLMSKVSTVLAQGRLADVRVHLAHLQAAVLELYVFACLQLLVFADVLVRVWVGSSFAEGMMVIRLVSLTIPFYLLFTSQRSIVDAASVTPHNTKNISVCAAIFLTLVGILVQGAPRHLLLEGIAVAMVIAVFILAWLTCRTVRKLYGLGIDWRRSALPLFVGVLLGGTSLLLHCGLGFRIGLGQFLLIELLSGALFLGLLKKLGSPWLPFFWDLAFMRSQRIEAFAGDQEI